MMQAASDIFLGWTKGVQANRYLYWRQLRDMKGSALVDTMSAFMLEYYAGLCGWTFARAHARSGDPIAIAAYLGDGDDFDTAITDFSQRYADQNEADYQAFVDGGPQRPDTGRRGTLTHRTVGHGARCPAPHCQLASAAPALTKLCDSGAEGRSEPGEIRCSFAIHAGARVVSAVHACPVPGSDADGEWVPARGRAVGR